jgi:hypothetical protein
MQHDIGWYNQATLNAETQMLLYNLGQLSEQQPPHFMMLATVSQTRTFSSTAGLQWTQALAALNPVTVFTRTLSPGTTITTTSSNIGNGGTWQAGPFSLSSNENPTITFVPIQGQEFFNRFESPMRDKFTDIFQKQDPELSLYLFVDYLEVLHGETGACPKGYHLNNYVSERRLKELGGHYHGYADFKACLDEILDSTSTLYLDKIDGHHPVPTTTPSEVGAAEVVNALDKGYEWRENGKNFALTTPIRIPVFLDYYPDYRPPEPIVPQSKLEPALVLYHGPKGQPRPSDLLYGTPKGYSWKQYTNTRGTLSYALVPEGEGYRNEGGRLVKPEKLKPPCKDQRCEEDKTRLLYADEIVDYAYPFPSDFIYVELRRNSIKDSHHIKDVFVFNTTAKDACFPSAKEPELTGGATDQTPNLVCGFFKVGTLLQIMQRLANMADACYKTREIAVCEGSNFGIGPAHPRWADRWMSIGSGKFIYQPAHNPNSDPDRAERDRKVFSLLYQLYQVSLVNTSQLVTSAPPVTISK